MIAEYFLENLSVLIEKSELNQLKLANQIGLPQGTVHNWYRRKNIPNTQTIENLAKFFNVEPYYFFMKPGTQGEAKPVERSDDWPSFIDELAHKNLNEIDLKAYYDHGGASFFLTLMRRNYETNHVGFADFYSILTAKLTEYAGLNLLEKIQARIKSLPKKESESA